MRTLLVTLVFSGVAMGQQQAQPSGRFYGPGFSEGSGQPPRLLDTRIVPPFAMRSLDVPSLSKAPQKKRQLFDMWKLMRSQTSAEPILIARDRRVRLQRMPGAPEVCSVPLIEAPI